MRHLIRIAIILARLIVMIVMTYVPPWREYHIQLRDPLPYVVEYSWLPTYVWYDQRPVSRGPGWGHEYFQSLLWIQLLVVGWIGTGAAFGVRGLFVYALTTAGFAICGYIPRILIPEPKPHEGWDSPLIFVFMAVTGLIGAGIGLAMSLAVLAMFPHRKETMKKKKADRRRGQ